MPNISKSQEKRFIQQNCMRCGSQRCDFSLEWREGCPKWHVFEAAALKERETGEESDD